MPAYNNRHMGLIAIVMMTAGLFLGGVASCPARETPVSAYEHGIFTSAKQDYDARNFSAAGATLKRYFDSRRHRHPYAYELYGHLLLQTRQAEQALKVLQAGVEEYPDRLNLVRNLAVAYARGNHPAQAGTTFLRAYALSEHKMPQLAFSAGVYLARGERYAEATQVIEKLIRREGLRPSWTLLLAQCHLHRHQEKEAARVLEKAVDRFPDNQKLWRMLAFSYYNGGAPKQAAAAYQVAFTLAPPSPRESTQLATLLVNLGAANLGATTAKDASPIMLDNIAYVLAKSGNLEHALQKALEAQRQAPTDERRFRVAQILYRMDRQQEAKSHYAALARSAGPYQGKAQWALALLAWQDGDWDAAHTQLKKMKQTDPKMGRRITKMLRILENLMQQG